MPGKRGLGKGLEALIPTQLVEAEFDPTAERDATGQRHSVDLVAEVPLDLIDVNPHQPRREFDEDALRGLAESIRHHGIIQPLVVSKIGARFELIAGERRLRASKLAGLKSAPVILRQPDEQEKLELALIENIQREDLNPIEVATAYRKLVDQFNLTNGEIGAQVGRDDSTVANSMRLLNLPLEAKRALIGGRISEGHCKVMLSLTEEGKQLQLMKAIIERKLSVRQAEEYARGLQGEGGSIQKAVERLATGNDLTRELGDYLGTKVILVRTAKGGRLQIEFYSDEELERIYQAIRKET